MIDINTESNNTILSHNNEKLKILVLSHGNMCTEIVNSAKFIGLDVDNIISLPMDELMGIETYEKRIRDLLDNFPDGSLVFVDFIGGTPFNIIARILSDYDIYAIAGVNLPMIIEAWSSYNTLKGKPLQDAVIEAGINGIVNINQFMNDI